MASPVATPLLVRPSPDLSITKVLLVDDDDEGRRILASQLEEQGLVVHEAGDAAAGIRALREVRPDVVVLDRRLRQCQGEPALPEFRKVAPRTPVIVLTGHAGTDCLASNGRTEAFGYVEKPCDPKALGDAIARAVKERRQRVESSATVHRPAAIRWLWGRVGFRPGVLVLGLLCLLVAIAAPAPSGLQSTLSAPRQQSATGDPIASFPSYAELRVGESIAQARARTGGFPAGLPGDSSAAVWSAKAMLGILGLAVLYWATRALPMSVTGMAVAFLLYAFGIFPPARVAQAFASDPVLLLAAVAVVASAAAATGLHRRLAFAVLATARAPVAFALVGLPALALVSSFLPGWAVLAFAIPALVAVHRESVGVRGAASAHRVVLGCMLAMTFASNVGAFGSPAGSGRNAALLAMLGDVHHTLGFADWLIGTLPVLLVASWVAGAYWLIVLRSPSKDWSSAGPAIDRMARARSARWSPREVATAVVLAVVVALWIAQAMSAPLRVWGLAGPALLGVVALVVLRVIDAKALSVVPWATVVSIAAACAVAKGLSATGVATWLGNGVARSLPSALPAAPVLVILLLVAGAVAASTLGEVAAVVLVGPVGIAASVAIGVDPVSPMLAIAVALSLANSLAIATPSNAVASALAKDARTGAPMIRPRDFLVHGSAVTALTIVTLSAWAWMGAGGWTPW